jgi:hypothetical protein
MEEERVAGDTQSAYGVSGEIVSPSAPLRDRRPAAS